MSDLVVDPKGIILGSLGAATLGPALTCRMCRCDKSTTSSVRKTDERGFGFAFFPLFSPLPFGTAQFILLPQSSTSAYDHVGIFCRMVLVFSQMNCDKDLSNCGRMDRNRTLVLPSSVVIVVVVVVDLLVGSFETKQSFSSNETPSHPSTPFSFTPLVI
jgi:hypothetical protein